MRVFIWWLIFYCLINLFDFHYVAWAMSMDVGMGLGSGTWWAFQWSNELFQLAHFACFASRTEIIYAMKQIYKMPRNNKICTIIIILVAWTHCFAFKYQPLQMALPNLTSKFGDPLIRIYVTLRWTDDFVKLIDF